MRVRVRVRASPREHLEYLGLDVGEVRAQVVRQAGLGLDEALDDLVRGRSKVASGGRVARWKA